MKNPLNRKLIRKTLSLLACFSIAVSTASYGGLFVKNKVSTVAAEAVTIIGDANVDGKFSIIDLLFLKRYMLNLQTITPEGVLNCDVNQDKIIDLTDTVALMNQYLNKPSEIISEISNITLKENTVTTDSKTAVINDSKVTIVNSGEYTINGNSQDVQIIINTAETDTGSVDLIFKDTTMNGSTGEPIVLVENADKTKIQFEGTNTFTSTYDTAVSDFAVIHAKDDLTIKASSDVNATVTISSKANMGIYCNNDLKLNGGNINISTVSDINDADAIKAKGDISSNTNITIDASGDGIKSTKSLLEIKGGNLNIKSGKDALQAETELNINGGNVVACGDRGLTGVLAVNITGGEVLATATDYQCENVSATQTTLVLDYLYEWAKFNEISVKQNNTSKFSKIPLKKFTYAIVSGSQLTTNSSYQLFTGGIQVKPETSSSFDFNTVSSVNRFTNINNSENSIVEYEEYFNQNKINSVNIKIDPNEWNNLIDNASKEEYHNADVVINGEVYEDIAVRTKGFSSLSMVESTGSDRFSFRLNMDKNNKQQSFHGLTDISLNNFYSDPSHMRDIICYNAMAYLDGISPYVSYTNLYVNDTLFGFYLFLEIPEESLAKRSSYSNDVNLYKAESTDCTLLPNSNPAGFELKYGNDENLDNIKLLISEINKVDTTNYKNIENLIDVESFLKGWAINSVCGNFDTYSGFSAKNYYLLYDNGIFKYVNWDYNLSIGGYMDNGASYSADVNTPLYQVTMDQRPLIGKLLAVNEYKQIYLDYVKQLVKYFENIETEITQRKTFIKPYVMADPRPFFSIDIFEKNTTRSATGIVPASTNPTNPWGGFGGFGGGTFSFGGENVSVVDFMVQRIQSLKSQLGIY